MAPKRKAGQNEPVETIMSLKKGDGEPLTRQDVQADMLAWLFSNSAFQFTPPEYPNDSFALFPTDRTWSFAELYIDCIANSAKAPKALKEKMAESQDFAVNFAKICLLINLNRLNTTHAFFLECRTMNRTFHCMPSAQLHEFTRKNLPDAPRLKAQLKACLLPQEKLGAAEKLKSIVEAGKTRTPSTTVVNAIFSMVNDAAFITSKYLAPGLTFTDVLTNSSIPSVHRAHALLFIIHHILQDPTAADVYASAEPVEQLQLTPGDTSRENIDTPEELAFAEEIKGQRAEFLVQLKAGMPPAPEPSVAQFVDTSKATRSMTAARGGSPLVDEWVPGAPVPSGYPGAGDGAEPFPLGEVVREDAQRYAQTQAEQYWRKYIDNHQQSKMSTLDHVYERMKLQSATNEDPLYDSDEEEYASKPGHWTFPELLQRVNVFQFRQGDDGPEQLLKYKGRDIRPAELKPLEPLPPTAAMVPGVAPTDTQPESSAASPSSEHGDNGEVAFP